MPKTTDLQRDKQIQLEFYNRKMVEKLQPHYIKQLLGEEHGLSPQYITNIIKRQNKLFKYQNGELIPISKNNKAALAVQPTRES